MKRRGRAAKTIFASGMKPVQAPQVADAGPVLVHSQVQLDGHVASTPTVVDGIAFCSVIRRRICEHTVVAVDLQSGSVRWQVTVGKWTHVDPISPLAHNGLLYIGTDDGNVVCLRQDTGETVWCQSVCRGADRVAAHSAMSIADPLVLVGTYGGDIVALDLTTGERRWRFPHSERKLENLITSRPVVWRDNVLFSNWLEEFRCVGLATGQKRWSLDVGWVGCAHHADSLLIGQELFIPGRDGWMRGLDLATRQFCWVVDGTINYPTHTPVTLGGVLYWRCDEDKSLNGYPLHANARLFPRQLLCLTTDSIEPYELSVHDGRVFCPSGPWLYVVQPRPADKIPTKYHILKHKSPHRFVTGLGHDGDLFCAGTATDKMLIGRLPNPSAPEGSHSR